MLRYTLGDRAVTPPTDHLIGPLVADLGVIAGYVLLLGACAVIVCRLASTEIGTRIGRVGLGCVLTAAAADVLENLGLLASTFLRGQKYSGVADFVATATATVATIKWCVLLTAAIAVPSAIVVLALRWRANRQFRASQADLLEMTRNSAKECDPAPGVPSSDAAEGAQDGAPPNVGQWWNECWQPPQVPSVHEEGTRFDNWSWINAYNVPGASDVVIDAGDRPVHAICLSGGGVRSASVAMGALQILARARPVSHREDGDVPALLDSVDYIVSVSGGGYTAGARLLACHDNPTPAAALGEEPTKTDKSRREDRPVRLSERFAEGSVEFEHIRRHSSYIADSLPSLLRALGYVLRNLIASAIILFWIPVALGLFGGYLLAYLPIAAMVPVPRWDGGDPPQRIDEDVIKATPHYFQALVDHTAGWWALGAFAIVAMILLGWAMTIEVRNFTDTSEALRTRVLRRMHGVVVVGLVVAALIVGLPALMRLCVSVVGTDFRPEEITGAVAGVLGLQYLTAIASMVWRQRSHLSAGAPAGRSWRRMLPPGVVPYLLVLITLAVILLAWLLVLGSVAAGVFGYLTQGVGGPHRQIGWLGWWIGGTAVVILLLCVADVTSLSLHPFYRWRLANTFAVRRRFRTVWKGALPPEPYAVSYPETEPTWLHTHGAIRGGGPKFVFSAAAAVSGAGKPAPGLNAVSFVLTSEHIGGPELGWLKTNSLWAASPPRLKRDLTVQAAVAVSGAAFASAMGRQNKGFQTLLAVSGARLGTWLPNPQHVARLCEQYPAELAGNTASASGSTRPILKGLPAMRGFTYFYRELFGRNSKDARLVQVTDGGHYENLGLVEALRRRARVIICIDGGGDPPPLLAGLGDAMRLARSELGVEIELDQEGPFAVQNLSPGSGEPFPKGDAFALLNSRITKGTVVRGRVKYPAASGLPDGEREGLIIFAKAVVWRCCPDWLLTYAGASEIFPHDSTSDQWFTESQFAAYTELGRILGTSAVEAYNAEGALALPSLVVDGEVRT